MLHALTLAKSRKVHATSLSEDEVTSTFFGPLQFMAPGDAWTIVQELGLIKPEKSFASNMPLSHEVLFWSRFRNPARKDTHWRSCEPDLVFHFRFENDQVLTLIVEIKWTARGSSTDQDGVGDQLARQWVAVSETSAGQITKHVYLTQSALVTSRGLDETAICEVAGFNANHWYQNTIGLTWADVGARLTKLHSGSDGVRLWATAALKFLILLNVVPFTGFKRIDYSKLSGAVAYRLGRATFDWPDVLATAQELTKWELSS